MENKITVDELIKGYIALSSEELRDKYIKSKVRVNNYVGYAMKNVQANAIVVASTTGKDGNIYIDSAKRYLNYIFALLNTWTNIQLNENDFINEYDRLEETSLLNVIMSMIPESEQKSFSTILNMKMDDFMTNEFNTISRIKNMIKEIADSLGSLGSIFDSISDDEKQVLMDKLMEIFEKNENLKNHF